MTVITLPEKLIRKKELVLIPRSEYEELLRISKHQNELKEGINQSLKEIRKKKTIGPFDKVEDLMKSLYS